jgi:hypothetical protein
LESKRWTSPKEPRVESSRSDKSKFEGSEEAETELEEQNAGPVLKEELELKRRESWDTEMRPVASLTQAQRELCEGKRDKMRPVASLTQEQRELCEGKRDEMRPVESLTQAQRELCE